MNDECLRAQEAISRAADREVVSAEDTSFAKSHCASCATCTAYVRTLLALKTLDTPIAPESTVTRALEAVASARAEDALQAAALTNSEEHPTTVEARRQEADAVGALRENQTDSPYETVRIGRHEMTQRAFATWAAAAAALLIVTTIAIDQGIRVMTSPTMVADEALMEFGSDVRVSPSGSASEDDAAQESALSAPPSALADASQARYVTFDSLVYSYAGEIEELPASSDRIGSLSSALDGDSMPDARTVYTSDIPGQLHVETDTGVAVFNAVTRILDGRTYGLVSAPVDAFGVWPSLPSSIPEPTLPDGSPVFKEAGEDALGVVVFTRPGEGPATGFAIAPGTPPSDPAAGNPGWTWWEPTR